MRERLPSKEPTELLKESVMESLQDISRRSENPNLLDRITLPAKRYVANNLARILDITPDEIAEIYDSE